jgi:hypothetical protein
MNRRIVALAASAATAAVVLAGCSTESGSTGEETSGNNAPAATAEETEDAAAEESADEPAEDSEAANPVFGETYVYENGLSVTVGIPTEFTPSDSAAFPEDATSFLQFEVKIVNGTGDEYDPALFTTTMQSGNTEAGEVFDSAQGFEGAPFTPLLDGRESVFIIGYGVTDPNDLVMQVSPGFEYDSALFTN